MRSETMDSLTKVVVLFAVLGIVGAGVFFFPQSPFYYKTLVVVTEAPADAAAATEPAADEAMEAEETEAETAQ